MPDRTRREGVIFKRLPLPKGWDEPHPAGICAVETEEEVIEELPFSAYRRVSTAITRQAIRAGALVQSTPADPRESAKARAADGG